MPDMRNDHYPQGTVQALMLTDLVSPNSSLALQKRLDKKPVTKPQFFVAEIFVTLQAVCMRLIPQQNPERMVDLAGCLDEMLAEGKGNGWRYDALPDDGKTFIIGLYGINKSAVFMYGKEFHLITANQQDDVLKLIQSGAATGFTWEIMPARLFFEELLAAITEIYYSHPYAKEDIGEVAMADAKGWEKIGLNERESQEPAVIKKELSVTN